MKRIYVNESACIGCHLCEVYCQLAHSQSKDLVKAFNRESPRPLPSVRVEERKPVCFAMQCCQCNDPVCVYSCLTGALQRHPEAGTVTVDSEKCIGCWTCILACPFGGITPDACQGKAVKCDLCAGKSMPACVMNCPNEALVYAESQEDTACNAAVNHLN